MIAKADHGRVVIVMTATVVAAAVAARLTLRGAGLIVAGGLLTGLLEAGLLLVQPRLLSAGLARRARGAGGTILTGSAGLTRLAHFTGLVVSRRFGAREAFGPCG